MTGDSAFSPTDQALSPSSHLRLTVDEGSQNSEHLDVENDLEIEGNDFENEGNDLDIASNGLDVEGSGLEIECIDLKNDSHQMVDIQDSEYEHNRDGSTMIAGESGIFQGKDYLPPVAGMEFESYDDAYNYYNCYAKELGFAIRVKSSWTKRNSKEKRGAVLCCNCAGFKTIKEANSRRKETRTGCLAMIRLRLVESNRWRVDEVKLEHNHLFDPERAQNSKSHKKTDVGTKRKLEPAVDVEIQTIKLYRTPIADPTGYGSSNSNEGETSNHIDRSRRLKLKTGDAQLIHDFFGRIQLTNPNLFYVMDLNDEGCLRNVFWIDSRSRSAYGYFGDVVAIDTSCISNKYEIPLITFVGINHHGRLILLGCGLVADESFETYIWLFRAWLTCMSGRPPQTIITDQCKAVQSAIAEVFPRAHHCLYLQKVMQRIVKNLGELQDLDRFQMILTRLVYDTLKLDEFEVAWEDMVQHFGITDHPWLRSMYEDRDRWAPAYLKDTFFAGMCTFQKCESLFNGYLHQQTSLKEFFETYQLVLQKKRQKEALDDFESRSSSFLLKTRCYYELQLSKLLTNEISRKFQDEVVLMSSCFSIAQVHANGPIITYMLKEQEGEGDQKSIKSFEVIYHKGSAEIRCICGCFNFNGYLCRHALCVLNFNGVEEIPFQYILSRWRKDFKRIYVPDLRSNNVDTSNPVQWVDHLYRRSMQVVEEGMISHDHYMVAWQTFKESLNQVRLAADKHA